MGPPPPTLFLDQTEARRAEKKFFGDQAPLYLGIWMTAPPPLPLSVGLNPPLKWVAFRFRYTLLVRVAIKAVVKGKGQ